MARTARGLDLRVRELWRLVRIKLTAPAATQKEIIAHRITGEGCEANPNWRPVWMQIPPARYVEGAASHAVDAWESAAALFAPNGPDLETKTEEDQSKQAA